MSEVVTINGSRRVPEGDPVPNVVEYCEELLTMAKTGKLRALATAEVHVGGNIEHGGAHEAYTLWSLLGAIFMMQGAYYERYKSLP